MRPGAHRSFLLLSALGLLSAVACAPTDKAPTDPSEPRRCQDLPWKQVSTGMYVACGVHTDGCVECWGNEGVDATPDTAEGITHLEPGGDDDPPDERFVQIDLSNNNEILDPRP